MTRHSLAQIVRDGATLAVRPLERQDGLFRSRDTMQAYRLTGDFLTMQVSAGVIAVTDVTDAIGRDCLGVRLG